MKRFRLIFHILYLLISIAVLYFSIDIFVHTEEYLSKVKLSAYVRFPKYLMAVFLLLSVFMLVEYIIQQIKISGIKSGVEDLENEIKELKAKLYDKGQTQASIAAITKDETETPEIPSEDDD
ncbi:MAG: hypothetical protein AAF616_04360 [Bacteroidota bacterium]